MQSLSMGEEHVAPPLQRGATPSAAHATKSRLVDNAGEIGGIGDLRHCATRFMIGQYFTKGSQHCQAHDGGTAVRIAYLDVCETLEPMSLGPM